MYNLSFAQACSLLGSVSQVSDVASGLLVLSNTGYLYLTLHRISLERGNKLACKAIDVAKALHVYQSFERNL